MAMRDGEETGIMVFSTIGRGLRNMARFSGRDTVSQFWIYAGSVLALAMATWMVVFIPFFAATLTRMQKFAAEHPDQADVVSGPGSYSVTIHGNHPELMPDIAGLMAPLVVIIAISVILLAAAVTRRLHDRDWRGYWGVPALIFLAIGMAIMPTFFDSFSKSVNAAQEPDMGMFGLLFLNNLLYLGSLAVLVIQLVQRGKRGANRFGEDPSG
jgi:uncharacterized membrane protein YhaH (DUF805 family)